VFLTQPASFLPLVLEQQQQQQHEQQQQGHVDAASISNSSHSMASSFLDKWLSVASARFLEEVIGM